MPQSLAYVYVHLIFSTKERRPFLKDPELRKAAHKFIGGASKRLGCQPMVVGGVEDHIRILAALDRTITIADWVKELKRSSNLWIAEPER